MPQATTYGGFIQFLKAQTSCATRDRRGHWRVCGHCEACEPIVSVERRHPVNWHLQRDERSHEEPLEMADQVAYQRFASEAWS